MPHKTSFQKLFAANSTRREKIEYLICSIIGSLFAFMTIFTIAKIPYLLPKYSASLTPTTTAYVIIMLLVLVGIQAITAWGLIYSRSWIKYIVAIHSIAVFLYSLIILPYFTERPISYNLLISGIPYFVAAILFWFFITLRAPSKKIIPIVVYIVFVIITIAFQITFTT